MAVTPHPSSSRTSSPVPFARAFRFSTTHNDTLRRPAPAKQPLHALQRSRTSSLRSRSAEASMENSTPAFTDPFTSHSSASSSFVTYDTPPAQPAPPQKRARNSILFASSFNFHRPRGRIKQKAPTPAPTPFMFSEVIEIGPPARTEEDEERERLRDAAAQSIGLDPVLLEDHAALDDASDDDDGDGDGDGDEHTRSATPMPTLPAFPSTHAALAPHALLAARVQKHYPPPSLLMFALARQWKMRVLVLTAAGRASGLATGAACLHVFKSAAAEERELERLEIGADSVVFVADQDVGGRRRIVKVGGADGAEMTLQIVDAAEAHSWITAIKHAVLTQRSLRAGLGLMGQTFGGAEPRGDMDVMLSMRAQGMLASPTASAFATDARSPSPPRASSVARAPSTAVSALRGLFAGAGTRPRSPSSASSAGSGAPPDESFGHAGTSLLGMLRSNSITSDRPLSPASPTLAITPAPSSTPSTPRVPDGPLAQLDRRIMQDQDRLEEEEPRLAAPGSGYGLLPAALGQDDSYIFRRVGSPSLQPPPRKRAWTASGAPMGPRARPDSVSPTYTHTNGSTADSFGIRPGTSAFLTAPPSPPRASGGGTQGHPESHSRTSISSASSAVSGELRTSSDFGSKRWSRQGTLPNRLTPPSGPPPAAPPTQSPPTFRSSMHRHPYAADPSPSRSPSVHSSPQNHGTFSKRTSGSSVHSVSTVSTTHSPNGGSSSLLGHHRPLSSHRASIPPPQRPAPLTALPPTPHADALLAPPPAHVPPVSAPATKTSFRESLVLRTHRLSLAPPSLPPTGMLPPRPDEPAARTPHRRSSSSGSTPLSPIPASPGTPLPPRPPTPPQPPSRAAALRQRLRMLSSPAPPPAPPSPAPSTLNPYSLPPTPTLGSPITTLQNDPAFLRMSPPPPLLRLPEGPDVLGVTSLSPPPRRGSRRAVRDDDDALAPRPSTADGSDAGAGHRRHVSLSLSPHPSAVSLVDVRI